jgi:hypothetical protein
MGTFESQKGKWGFFTDLLYPTSGLEVEHAEFSVGGVTGSRGSRPTSTSDV